MSGLLLAEGLTKEHLGEHLHGRLLLILEGVGAILAPGLMTTPGAGDDKGSARLLRATLHAQVRFGLPQDAVELRILLIPFPSPRVEQHRLDV